MFVLLCSLNCLFRSKFYSCCFSCYWGLNSVFLSVQLCPYTHWIRHCLYKAILCLNCVVLHHDSLKYPEECWLISNYFPLQDSEEQHRGTNVFLKKEQENNPPFEDDKSKLQVITIISDWFSEVLDAVHLILNTVIVFAIDQLQNVEKCSGYLRRNLF